MATQSSPNEKGTPAPQPKPLYDAFPEPRAWAQQWDGSALYTMTKSQAKPKQ